jgi:hypothetical protein|tara:strand:+ start:2280 stop:2453 length:174 start_codon:yes stop_codon:yes gene_type:complete
MTFFCLQSSGIFNKSIYGSSIIKHYELNIKGKLTDGKEKADQGKAKTKIINSSAVIL